MKTLSFDDITLVPNYNDIPSRKDVDTGVQFGNLSLTIPILSANMDTVTGSRMASKIRCLGGIGFLHRFCSVEENIRMYEDSIFEWQNTIVPRQKISEAVVSLGINENLDRFLALYEIGARYFCVDVAHGHSKAVGKFVRLLKQTHEDIFVVAGNVCTYAGADYLSSCGADIIKVGISPGSVCKTRVATGFGVPQFSAILECARVSKPIIADGGIRSGGDAVKAFVAGASYIMCGGLLASTEETPGELIQDKNPSIKIYDSDDKEQNVSIGRCYKTFRGMASKEAQEDYMGAMSEWKAAEGIQTKILFKGSVVRVINDLMGGIRSGMTYAGCRTLDELRRKVEWREISQAGYKEGLPQI